MNVITKVISDVFINYNFTLESCAFQKHKCLNKYEKTHENDVY
jgi:hypothetical protein